jgi:hypothetical protein
MMMAKWYLLEMSALVQRTQIILRDSKAINSGNHTKFRLRIVPANIDLVLQAAQVEVCP